jgi:hypothetical protein
MPDPGSHAYDVQRTRLRAQYDDDGTQNTIDGKAHDAANAELQRGDPPATLGDPERADDGEVGRHVPHPPVGESHRFIFRPPALDRTLGLGEGVTAEQLRAAAEGHVVATGTLVGVVAR